MMISGGRTRRSRMTTNVAFGGGKVLRYGLIVNWKRGRENIGLPII